MSSPRPPPPSPPGGSAPSAPQPNAAAAAAAAKTRPIPPYLAPLRFVGIPESVLAWKPRLPSRNWSIFLTVTGTLTGLWYYDRRECERLKLEYARRVEHLAKEPMHPSGWPRKVLVYTCKTPGDEDYDKGLLWFKRYVKPVLVAAAIDWETVTGTRHGGLARDLQQRIYSRRRQLAGLEPWGVLPSGPGATAALDRDAFDPAQVAMASTPFALSPQDQLQREIDGAVVLVGRPAYKEYMWALKQGWTTQLPPQREDTDEPLAKELADDGKFDELPPEEGSNMDDAEKRAMEAGAGAENLALSEDGVEPDGAGAPLPSRLGGNGGGMPNLGVSAYLSSSKGGASASSSSSSASEPPAPAVDARLLAPPAQVPAQPPLAYVDYENLVGLKHMPTRIVRWFNRRADVRKGGDAALRIAFGDKTTARDFHAGPSSSSSTPSSEPSAFAPESGVVSDRPPQGGDLDWGLECEARYHKRFRKLPEETEKARKAYYDALPRKLRDTRTLSRGEREPTTLEKREPPLIEAQLREERFRREKEWRGTMAGWEMLNADKGVEWSEAFRGSLRVLDHIPEQPWREGGEGTEEEKA